MVALKWVKIGSEVRYGFRQENSQVTLVGSEYHVTDHRTVEGACS